jgi:hypothetical protein
MEENMKKSLQLVRPTNKEDAERMALVFGLKLGGGGTPFAGAFTTKGLEAHKHN